MTPDNTRIPARETAVCQAFFCPAAALRVPHLRSFINMFKSLLAVMLGGAVGCSLRWLISLRFNTLFPNLPPGTLLVNLAGGFIIGAAMAYFIRNPHLDPTWKLLIVTGLCGGLTTFSTFSAEIVMLLQSGKYLWAMSSVMVHLIGSLLMTFAGFAVVNLLG
jgi:fluoride exporter